eukprot:2051040-Pyramimonas_sp.AAC.1
MQYFPAATMAASESFPRNSGWRRRREVSHAMNWRGTNTRRVRLAGAKPEQVHEAEGPPHEVPRCRARDRGAAGVVM